MKRTTITIISLIIGASFFGLLFLQGRIITSMVKMRKEQFDETVLRALDQTSRDMERNETFRYLEEVARRSAFSADSLAASAGGLLPGATLNMTEGSALDAPFALSAQKTARTRIPKGSLTLKSDASIDVANQRFQDFVKNAYLYQKGVLDEVIYTILYNASDKDFRERVDFRLLDSNLRNELESAGINLPYHFSVYDIEGREVYRCADYSDEGSDNSYTQTLFRNDPSQKMGQLRVHFPDMDTYILGVANKMIPVLVFTILLFLTFSFTVWLIVRQKRETEMKNDFINNMTHEFKTPISSISLAAQMLGDKSITKSEAMLDNLSSVIVGETRRLRYQVEKVLQMSLYERGNIRFNEKEIDANVVIDDVVKTFQLKVKQSGGTLTAALDAEDGAIFVDEMHFTNVIFNLMDNAVKYRRDDVPLELRVSTSNQGQRLIVTVEDNGIGIRSEDLKHIFDRFYRVHTGNKHDVKGFGLGLAYVKGMVDLMHGTIKAESQLRQGTRFVISLPLID
ncbi:MAG: HAMP domain-containing histidine kinase [Bacteroidaceae bacterium]|nr:HAMP domain-containing histidine kinase [Bacteroidaceae bacterium]